MSTDEEKSSPLSESNENLPVPSEERSNQKLLREIRALPEFQPLKAKQRRFILAYCGTGGITRAAKLARCSDFVHYNWLNRDPKYAEAFKLARVMFGDLLEQDILDEALNGVEHKVMKKGELIESWQQKNTVLRIFTLKGFKPEYRDNFQVNQFAGPVQLNVKLDGV